MIGLDTNLLVRYIMQDDKKQVVLVNKLLEDLTEADPGWVSTVCLVELVWVLESIYELSRAEIAQAMRTLLEIDSLSFEKASAVSYAVRTYAESNADFADLIIERLARLAGCRQTFTFDKSAAKSGGMTLLA